MTSPAPISWRPWQALVWCLAVCQLLCLLALPALGLRLFWNALIPALPALLLLAPGLWRNLCPLATTGLALRRLRLSKTLSLSPRAQGRLQLLGTGLLLGLIPLRRVLLDHSAAATLLCLLALAGLALLMGALFDWKAGWCASLCPVLQVERLYGSRPVRTVSNAQCSACARCVKFCPDSVTPRALPALKQPAGRWAALLLCGGFPGFVWGWFQVPELSWSLQNLLWAYLVPVAGMVVSLALFWLLRRMSGRPRLWERLFPALAIGTYYALRLPRLLGFGPVPGDGLLVDLSAWLPASTPTMLGLLSFGLALAWLVPERSAARSWTQRPAYAAAA